MEIMKSITKIILTLGSILGILSFFMVLVLMFIII